MRCVQSGTVRRRSRFRRRRFVVRRGGRATWAVWEVPRVASCAASCAAAGARRQSKSKPAPAQGEASRREAPSRTAPPPSRERVEGAAGFPWRRPRWTPKPMGPARKPARLPWPTSARWKTGRRRPERHRRENTTAFVPFSGERLNQGARNGPGRAGDGRRSPWSSHERRNQATRPQSNDPIRTYGARRGIGPRSKDLPVNQLHMEHGRRKTYASRQSPTRADREAAARSTAAPVPLPSVGWVFAGGAFFA